MTEHLLKTTAEHPPRPSVVALLRSTTLIGAARHQLALPRMRACDIQLATTLTAAQLLLENPATALLLVELDEPHCRAPATQADTGDTLRWLQQQHARHAELTSVAFSHHRDANTVVSALCAGTSGYLVKDPITSADAQISDLLDGMEQLADGKPPVSDAVLPHLVQAVRASRRDLIPGSAHSTEGVTPPGGTTFTNGDAPALCSTPAKDSHLSKRETEVLALAAKGFTYAEMAGLLNLSVHTISTHTRRIYAKLEVNSRCAAIYEATRQGLLLEPSAAW